MISCCFCQNEFESESSGCGHDCDCDLNEMGKIRGGYWSDYDDQTYFFYHETKPFQLDFHKCQRKYRHMSIFEIEKKFQITPSRGDVGSYKYVICNSCVKNLIDKKQIMLMYGPNRFPCALCGNKEVEFYYLKKYWRTSNSCLRNFPVEYKDDATFQHDLENYVKVILPFESPVEKDVILLDDFMTVCNTCYFFYKKI